MQKIGKVTKEDVVDIICDMCGESCKKKCDYEYATLRANWGYDSRKDMESHSCDLCESCYDKIVRYIKRFGGKIQIVETPWP